MSMRVWIASLLGCGTILAGERENPRLHVRGYGDFPDWEGSKETPHDTFRFARIHYDSWSERSGRRFGKWQTDYPEAELNFSWRLQQLTSLRVHPDPVVVEIEAEQIKPYPFLYMVEPGHIDLTEEQAAVLRDYLLNGGFLMVDDFWGDEEWEGFYRAFKMMFPDREPEELPLSHEVFHCVFDLKEKPQIPAIGTALEARDSGLGVTYEWYKVGAETPHFRGVFDDEGRMMMIICHNTDLGDGWEREGENEWYFREFSEKKSFPMGINIVFYALTH
ncbi:MAG: protein of unknown function DUF4159 [Verrucomicrobia bacterium]|jgi:hypothetical protein|nr:MAG: protein of unknown function DUF4159 [Verrucomicrobiota bacterium]